MAGQLKDAILASLTMGAVACSSPAMSGPKSDRLVEVAPQMQEGFAALISAEPTPTDTISYINSSDKTFPIHILSPPGQCPEGGRPGLVMFHGGGWKRGDPSHFHRQAMAYNDLGITVLTPAYSLEDTDGTPPQQALQDAVSAWDEIVDRADDLCIDLDRLGAGGGSAGGHLGAALVTVGGERAPNSAVRPRFLVLFNPVIDNSPDGYGHDRIGSDWTWFSPLHNIPEGHPDTLFLLGDQDELIPVSTGEAYCDRVEMTDAKCMLLVYENAQHGWFNQIGFIATLTDSVQFLSDWLADVDA